MHSVLVGVTGVGALVQLLLGLAELLCLCGGGGS